MAEQWLIDGYNLLYALQSQSPKKSSPSRERLLAMVAEFASFKNTAVLLVLDGVGDPGELGACRTSCFEAVYSQKIPADAYIEKHLYENREKQRLVVVTDDRAITNIARGCGASVLGTSAFAELLKECKKEGSDFLQKGKSREHGFHRPFEDKLKDVE